MDEFIDKNFDPTNDPSRPPLGEEVVMDDGKVLVIGKVENWNALRIITTANPPLYGFDRLLVLEHPTRPAIHWMCWANEKGKDRPQAKTYFYAKSKSLFDGEEK